MYYYAHHIGDFQRDTAMLNDHQSMTYLRLLWMYYDTEQPLPDDTRRLAFKVGSDPDTVYLLLDHFFEHDGNEWRHQRCDSEIAEFIRRSENGKKAAQKRWSNAPAMPTQCDRNATASNKDANAMKIDAIQEPISKNQEPIEGKSGRATAKRFTPPTVDDVRGYCKQRNNAVDPQRFVDFYESKGWVVGKTKMKDWKASVRTWESKQREAEPVQRRRKML